MSAHQAPPSLGSSRQEHWGGLPFPSPMSESEKWKWSRWVCPALSDPVDCSLPGSSVHGIFQARLLEWGAIAFSNRAVKISFLVIHLQCISSPKINICGINSDLSVFQVPLCLLNWDVFLWSKHEKQLRLSFVGNFCWLLGEMTVIISLCSLSLI